MQQGSLDQFVSVTGRDEISVLGASFNKMAAQLKETFATLEQRVAERTHSLELAAEVGRSVSQVRALNVMLKDAAELIRKQFDLYYVQIYLTNQAKNNLLLESGTGTVGTELVGRGHRLSIDTGSINGRAAMERRSVVISDTFASATFKPNPLLPDTHSEMAIPLLVGETVVGVLDLQSNKAGELSQDNLPAFEALAGQLAIAIQNAGLLAETEQARAEVEKQAARLVRRNWDEHLDAIHKPEQTGFVYEGNQVVPLAEAGDLQLPAEGNALSVPIAITGEPLGSLVVELDDRNQGAHNAELVHIVARQVAQQIENLRLLESAERYRFEAEEAIRRATQEGWQEYLEKTGKPFGYLYDLKEVRPLNDDGMDQNAVVLPLKVRDEVVGKVAIQDLVADDREALDLAGTVAERLSAHIENLRLSLQTEQALAMTRKRAQREQSLRQITSAVRGSTDPSVILRTAVRELGSVLGRKMVIRLTSTGSEDPAQPMAEDPSGSTPLADRS
jgi:GAF domain-containing protein